MALKAHCGVLEGDLFPWDRVSAPWCTQSSIKLIKSSQPYWDTPERTIRKKLFISFIPLYSTFFIFDNLVNPPADLKRITLC